MKVCQILGIVVAASGASLIQFASPAEAGVFNFKDAPVGNASVKSFLDSGSSISLSISNSNSTGTNPNTINNDATNGLCAFAASNGTARCGYNGAVGAGVSSFQLKFDKSVYIQSFNVSTFNVNNTTSGSIAFSLDNSDFSNSTTIAGIGSVSLVNPFKAVANQSIYVRTSAVFSPRNTAQTGLIRLSSLTAEVPAPLPILGAAVGFRFSRRIRKRILAASLNG